MKRTLWMMVVAGVMGAAISRLQAQEPPENPREWKPRVTSVSVFKNGMGFFIREGKVALQDGWCVADTAPPAAFGTLAIFAGAADQTVDIVGAGAGEIVRFDGVDAPQDSAAKRARLETYKYLQLRLTYRLEGVERVAVGQLVSVDERYVLLQAEGNCLAVPLEGVQQLQLMGKSLRVHVVGAAATPPAEADLHMAYLRKGITWIPEYTLTLVDEDAAELTLRGTLVNEAEDLVHCDVNLVVGVPHFLHSDYLAPLAAGQAIRAIGAAVAPRELMGQITNRAQLAGASIEQVAAGAAGFTPTVSPPGRSLLEATGSLPQWEGAGSSDFTVYHRPDLTLRQGEKAVVTLFIKKIHYHHIYRWSPPRDIEHFLVLANDTGTSWTTGPCLTLSGGKALSEDLLQYVPVAGQGEIPVTTAVNVTCDQTETEVERKLKAYQPNNNLNTDLVTLNGELTVRNFGKTACTLVITAPVTGKPTAASDSGVITLDHTNLKLMERSGKIAWNLTLQPDETRKITYAYERYVPSY